MQDNLRGEGQLRHEQTEANGSRTSLKGGQKIEFMAVCNLYIEHHAPATVLSVSYTSSATFTTEKSTES